MSESEEHRGLVRLMADRLCHVDSAVRVSADLLDYPKVPNVMGFRPDVYGYHEGTGCEYICEAKTFKDLTTARSYEQIVTLLDYLRHSKGNVFVLGGIGLTALRAKTVLRFYVQSNYQPNCSLQVFDGLDYWKLDQGETKLWHLR